ncbi:MAG: hypothetical protein U5L01_10785 [Rheinheimera sp.]|nr:hypothetical protein [Rheinheimera sp.]
MFIRNKLRPHSGRRQLIWQSLLLKSKRLLRDEQGKLLSHTSATNLLQRRFA